MDTIFKDLKDCCVVYIDDILVFSKTREEHKKHLKLLCEKFQKYGIILSPEKIELEKESIEFWGIILDQKCLKLQEHILSKVRDFPDTLENITQLQNLLGILNYGRNFIKNLSKIEIHWLTKLRKNVIFKWTVQNVALIKQIKEMLKLYQRFIFLK